MMWKSIGSPFGVGFGALSVLLLAAGSLVSSQGDGSLDQPTRTQEEANEGARKGASGEPILCGDGREILSSYVQEGDRFVLVGTFQDVSQIGIAVSGPTGEHDVRLTRSPEVEGEFFGGEAVRIAGVLSENGELEATDIRLECTQAVVREIDVGPAPDPAAGSAQQPEVQPQNASPAQPETPPPPHATQGDSDDHDRDGDRDEDGGDDRPGNRGHGEVSGQGNGNRPGGGNGPGGHDWGHDNDEDENDDDGDDDKDDDDDDD